MKILIIGDCHGNFLPVMRAIRQARELWDIDAVIQVGDFGFYEDSLNMFLAQYIRFPVPVYAIDGNHEDHVFLADGLYPELTAANLHYVKRGSVLEFDGARIGFCGGALNVDREQEWLPSVPDKPMRLPSHPVVSNWVNHGDRERCLESFKQLDLIVTHSCPSNVGVGRHAHPALMDGERQFIRRMGVDPGLTYDVGEPELAKLWHGLKEKPPHWVYGHFHRSMQKTVDGTLFTCVGSADLSDGFLGVLPFIYDTRAKALELMNIKTTRLLGK